MTIPLEAPQLPQDGDVLVIKDTNCQEKYILSGNEGASNPSQSDLIRETYTEWWRQQWEDYINEYGDYSFRS